MLLSCLKFVCAAPAVAESKLATYLLDTDVQVMRYEPGTVLLPPHLQQALEVRLGAQGMQEALQAAGLVHPHGVTVDEVIRWMLTHGETPTDRLVGVHDEAVSAEDKTWQLDMCGVRRAWERFGGPWAIDWQDVSVGQVDTGFTEHPAFGFPDEPSIDQLRARSFTSGAGVKDGRDTLSGGSGGHGTMSGSLIGAFDMATPCLGVAPRVRMVPARIGDCVVIDRQAAEFEAAVRYLVDEAHVSVINVSMGTFAQLFAPTEIKRALDHCYERGVIMLCAAGDAPIREWPAFPARLPRSIAVGGVSRQRQRWALSSFGDWVDLAGPAKNVWCATTKKGPAYGFSTAMCGTALATAMASGAAALWVLAHQSEITARYSQPWQRVEAFREMARKTALPGAWTGDAGLGTGILNVEALMDASQLPNAADLVRR
jgi:hypothetical protein